jgi:hypothetical protein
MTGPDVHLLLSQEAAKVLDKAVGIAMNEEMHLGPESDIIESIRNELQAQIEKPKTKKKGKS